MLKLLALGISTETQWPGASDLTACYTQRNRHKVWGLCTKVVRLENLLLKAKAQAGFILSKPENKTKQQNLPYKSSNK